MMKVTDEMVERAESARIEVRQRFADLWPRLSVQEYRLLAMRAALEAALSTDHGGMSELPIAKRYLVPLRRLFPIWRYQPIHWNADDQPDAFAWGPDWYGVREISHEDAVRLAAA